MLKNLFRPLSRASADDLMIIAPVFLAAIAILGVSVDVIV
jgi:hypothetical protein